ncbi:hypothetical protein LOD99_437 [Oopsacas minuta]|uniref:Uncharacterized protein n=1 Tax=Oopsacas minuta TaxID=111878 RepID=A0AAV7K974_9METZ|nr:hypothetical protein LOD99_437 [Oopsacas minuta]
MRLIFSFIFTAFWKQIVAPEVREVCQSLGAVREFTNSAYPQLCNDVGGMLEWNYFCNNIIMNDGNVICRALGYPGYESVEEIHLDIFNPITKIANLNCAGNETRLTDCPYSETTNSCMVAKGLICTRCSVNSMCSGPIGQCTMNGKCKCSEGCISGYCYLGRCICSDGFAGTTCNECDPQCDNGGICSASGMCECMSLYSGDRCEFNNSIITPTNSTISIVDSLTLIIIAAAVPSLIFSCTLIIICFGILAFLMFFVSQIKPSLGRKKVENTKMTEMTVQNTNKQFSNRKPHEYELEFENSHDYYYIRNSQVGQNSSNPFLTTQVRDDNYEIIESRNMSNQAKKQEDPPQDFSTNSTSNLVDKDPKSDYVIDDINDYS